VADLKPPTLDADRRGQVLLVTGFALAVTFVGLALVFNSVIYTENLATRSESTTTTDPVSHAESLRSGTERLVGAVNEMNASNTSNYAQVETNFTWAFENMTAIMTKHQLGDGQVVADEFAFPNRYRATVIHQVDEERNFSNADRERDWTLVSGAEGARGLRVFVGAESLLEGNDTPGTTEPDSEPFNVTVRGGGDTWRLNVSSDPRSLSSDATLVGVRTTADEHVTCGAPDPTTDPFWINVSEGTVDGTECAGLDFAGGLDAIEDIEFNNASNVNGTYRLVVNRSNNSAGIDQSNYGQLPAEPSTEPGIWGVDLTVDYESDVLRYVREMRAVPGEKDD
jgi:hypothetical protein